MVADLTEEGGQGGVRGERAGGRRSEVLLVVG